MTPSGIEPATFALKSFVQNTFCSTKSMFSWLARYEHGTACKSSWQVHGTNYCN